MYGGEVEVGPFWHCMHKKRFSSRMTKKNEHLNQMNGLNLVKKPVAVNELKKKKQLSVVTIEIFIINRKEIDPEPLDSGMNFLFASQKNVNVNIYFGPILDICSLRSTH